jgi:ribosomal protein S18 acetylase RimI-like enzyme
VDIKQFNDIASIAKTRSYSSLNYADYDEIKSFDVIIDNESIVLLHKDENDCPKIHYATDDLLELIASINTSGLKGLIKFIPFESIREFELNGFEVHCAFQDYLLHDLTKANISLTPNSNILFATVKDAEQLSKISKACIGLSRGFWGETTDWFIDWLASNEVIINLIDHEIVGFCCVSIYSEGNILWIREIAVHPDFQGRGISKELMSSALQYGVSKGAKKSFLAVDIDNDKAIKLYEYYGYQAKENEIEVQMLKK